MPQEEFGRRLDALWASVPGAARAIVYGSPRHHAELAYLTNFIPKLEPAMALLSRTGAPLLFAGGGANMLAAARPLTWISEIAPLRDAPKTVTQWLADTRDGSGRHADSLLIGTGTMPGAMRRAVADAAGASAHEATAQLWKLMARKSAREIAAIREAFPLIDAAFAAMRETKHRRAGVTKAVLAGEWAANARGAQDVRTLFSIDGGRTLRPFTGTIDDNVEPLMVYIAVRRFNYWAEGFTLLSERPASAVTKAAAALRLALSTIKAGAGAADVQKFIGPLIMPYRVHPVTERAFATKVGLALEDPPFTDMGATFEAGEVYSVKVGITDNGDQHAIVSATIQVHTDGNDVLWSSVQA
jgi:hypothetical protein